MTPDELTAMRDALVRARATGLQTAEFTAGNGTSRRLTYRSDAELVAALRDVERMLAAPFTAPPPNVIRFHTSKDI